MYIQNSQSTAPTSGISGGKDNSILDTDSMDSSDFLHLLITELQNQDPLNPMDNSEFGAQVAQFNMLEKLTEIGGNISKLSGQLKSQSTLQKAIALVNKKVQVDDKTGNKIVEGVVDSIKINKDSAKLIVNDREYLVEDVVKVLGK